MLDPNHAADFVFDPDAPAFVSDPFPTYAWLREHAPVYRWDQGRAFLVSCHADVAQLLADRRFSINGRDWIHAPPVPNDGPLAEFFAFLATSLTAQPSADHLRLRRLVNPAVTPRAVARMRERVQRVVDTTLNEAMLNAAIRGESLDVRRDFAEWLPLRVIADIFDIPAAHEATFRAFSAALIIAVNPWIVPEQLLRMASVAIEGMGILLEIIDERRRHLGDDLLSDLIRVEEAGDRLTSQELLRLIASLVIAGADTTVHALCFAVLDLLRHPEAWRAVVADRSLLRNAIEESLRHQPFGKFGALPRYALEDAELRGTRIPKGEMAVPVISATGRDPSAYPDPDVYDIHRKLSSTLAFGIGPHVCVGAALARLELEVAIGTLIERFPSMTLVDEAPVFRPNPQMRDMESLRVALRGEA
ncbi:MAG TPA: cytochrome P450 [Kofleriaceae bacterium]